MNFLNPLQQRDFSFLNRYFLKSFCNDSFSTFGFLKELSFSHINHICSLRVSKGRNLILHRLQGIIDCIQFILLKTFHAVARVSKSLRNGF